MSSRSLAGRSSTRVAGPRRPRWRRGCSRIHATPHGRTTRRCWCSGSYEPGEGTLGAHEAIQLARAVGVPDEECDALVDRGAAAAEVAWLEHDAGKVEASTRAVLREALERDDDEAVCRLSYWRGLADLETPELSSDEGPYALALTGRWRAAADAWVELGCPYEAAFALGQVDDEDAAGERSSGCDSSGRVPRRQWWRGGCVSAGQASRAAPGRPPAPTGAQLTDA